MAQREKGISGFELARAVLDNLSTRLMRHAV
jgi:hypothetical protein